MNVNPKSLIPGCKLAPMRKGGSPNWYPYVTFIRRNTDTECSVILSSGRVIDEFNPNGWMPFKVLDECLENK